MEIIKKITFYLMIIIFFLLCIFTDCGCHGPVMTKGMVAWAAGQSGGPDFFIDNYIRPAEWWGTQHTIFGEIIDESSFNIIENIFKLPVYDGNGMTFLEKVIHFDLSFE